MSPLGLQIFPAPHKAAIVCHGKARGVGVWNCVVHVLLFQMYFSLWKDVGLIAGIQWYYHMRSSLFSCCFYLVSVQTSCTCGGATRSLEVLCPGTVAWWSNDVSCMSHLWGWHAGNSVAHFTGSLVCLFFVGELHCHLPKDSGLLPVKFCCSTLHFLSMFLKLVFSSFLCLCSLELIEKKWWNISRWRENCRNRMIFVEYTCSIPVLFPFYCWCTELYGSFVTLCCTFTPFLYSYNLDKQFCLLKYFFCIYFISSNTLV